MLTHKEVADSLVIYIFKLIQATLINMPFINVYPVFRLLIKYIRKGSLSTILKFVESAIAL